MARKHNTKHNRSTSHYPDRLRDRGESTASIRMPFIDKKGRKHDTIEALMRADGKDAEKAGVRS